MNITRTFSLTYSALVHIELKELHSILYYLLINTIRHSNPSPGMDSVCYDLQKSRLELQGCILYIATNI